MGRVHSEGSATAHPLYCSEPLAAPMVQPDLDRALKRTVRRLYWSIYRITEIHGVTRTDTAWILGTEREHAIPRVPIEPSRLRWTRAKGLMELQKAIDADQVGRVTERAGRRRVRLDEEPEGSFKFRADWRPIHQYLTQGGEVSLYYVSQYAGIKDEAAIGRLACMGSEPMLDAGERLLLLRAMIKSGALQGWGEKPECPSRRRQPEGRMLGEDGELPLAPISPGLNEALSFPEGSYGEERDATAEPHRLTPAQAGHAALAPGGAHRVEDEHPLATLAKQVNEAFSS